MAKPRHTIHLLPSALTSWQEQQRVQGCIDLPGSPDGLCEIQQLASTWAPTRLPRCIYCPSDEASRQTAEAFALRLKNPRIKIVDDLREIDLGFWQGLTYAEVKDRYPKAYSQWKSNPCQVVVPQGETLGHLAERALSTMAKLVDKADGHGVAFVLRPLTYRMATTWLNGAEPLAVLPTEPPSLACECFELDEMTWQQLRAQSRADRTGSRRIPA